MTTGTASNPGFDRGGTDTAQPNSLSVQTFEYHGIDYGFTSIWDTGSSHFSIRVPDLPGSARSDLTLHVGSRAIPFGDATAASPTSDTWYWLYDSDFMDLGWSNRQTISLRLTVNAPPQITDVRITSVPSNSGSSSGVPDTYGRGEAIEVTVTFDEPVAVTGRPRATLWIGETAAWRGAPYHRGSGTTRLVFRYVVQEDDRDGDGVAIGSNALAQGGDRDGDVQGGGTINSVASGLAAPLANDGVDSASGDKVDGSIVRPPAPPANLAATPGDGRAELSWDAPVYGGGRPITRYEYRYKTDGSYPAGWTAIPDSAAGGTNAGRFTAETLTNERRHTFQVRAVNAEGAGAVSNEASVTPTPGICGRTRQVQEAVQEAIFARLAGMTGCAAAGAGKGEDRAVATDPAEHLTTRDAVGATAPAALEDLAATPGNGEVLLSWTPVFDGGSPVTRYEYRYKTDGSYPPGWRAIPDSTAGAANAGGFRVKGLVNGTTYTFQARAVNAVDEGAAVAAGPVTPSLVHRLRPGAVERGGEQRVRGGGDGDGRGRGGAGRAGGAGGGGGLGDEPDGELDGTVERGACDHRLRLPLPGADAAGELDGGDGHREHGAVADRLGPGRGHGLRGAGAGDQRRGHRRLVGVGQRRHRRQHGADGGEAGADAGHDQ